MDPLWILLIGVVIVVGGILGLKLHAFLALLLGALAVAVLTPAETVERFNLEEAGGAVVAVDTETGQVQFRASKRQTLVEGSVLLVFDGRRDSGNDPQATLEAVSFLTDKKLWSARVVQQQVSRPPQPGDLVVEPTARAAATARSQQVVAERIAGEFGRTCASIGILVALAAIVGETLLISGAADRIVRSTLGLLGEPRAPLAFLSSGYLLGIPVFFDTVFYLLIPLGKAMRLRTGRNYLLYVLTIIAGATMTHSLVPPTPGPLAVAAQLGVDMGLMILGGMIVGAITAAWGLAYALWINRRVDIPLRESADTSLEDLEELSSRDDSQLPPLWLSLLPIVLPVILISGKTVWAAAVGTPASGTTLARLEPWVRFLGDQNVALGVSAAIGLAMLAWRTGASRKEMAVNIERALASGAVIILITAAGGAFGGMLRESGIGGRIQELSLAYSISGIGILALAFLVTVLIRTAQGSATVAMITAASILGSAFTVDDLPFHPLYLALVTGCGSKLFLWMNDSGFWVMTKLSGLREEESLKYVMPMTASMGFVGAAVTMLGAKLWPLV
jgi:GntP family gluconate:H+ symporter